jgi:hypothetical protein
VEELITGGDFCLGGDSIKGEILPITGGEKLTLELSSAGRAGQMAERIRVNVDDGDSWRKFRKEFIMIGFRSQI